jgi:RNA polymerase sigma-70 factor (ECF subfamily)
MSSAEQYLRVAHPAVLEAEGPPEAPALRDVFREHAPFVLRILRRMGVPEADLEDAAQDVFVVVHRKLPGYDGRASVRTWLFGIAQRIALARRRRAHARHEVTRADVDTAGQRPSLSEDAAQLDARALLIDAIDRLDSDKRAVFVLYEIEGFSMHEVAAAVECPLATAYSRLRLARELVRASIERRRRRTP